MAQETYSKNWSSAFGGLPTIRENEPNQGQSTLPTNDAKECETPALTQITVDRIPNDTSTTNLESFVSQLRLSVDNDRSYIDEYLGQLEHSDGVESWGNQEMLDQAKFFTMNLLRKNIKDKHPEGYNLDDGACFKIVESYLGTGHGSVWFNIQVKKNFYRIKGRRDSLSMVDDDAKLDEPSVFTNRAANKRQNNLLTSDQARFFTSKEKEFHLNQLLDDIIEYSKDFELWDENTIQTTASQVYEDLRVENFMRMHPKYCGKRESAVRYLEHRYDDPRKKSKAIEDIVNKLKDRQRQCQEKSAARMEDDLPDEEQTRHLSSTSTSTSRFNP